jgi:hypothetical protein
MVINLALISARLIAFTWLGDRPSASAASTPRARRSAASPSVPWL